MKSVTLQAAVSYSTSNNGPWYELGDIKEFSIHADFSGADLAGTMLLQGSNDGTDPIDLSNSSVSVTSAASVGWDPVRTQFKYVRTKWTAASGPGTGTVILAAKGVR